MMARPQRKQQNIMFRAIKKTRQLRVACMMAKTTVDVMVPMLD